LRGTGDTDRIGMEWVYRRPQKLLAWPFDDKHSARAAQEDDVTNPFEDENGVYHVLVNEEGQHSLWPSFVEVPAGWTIIHASDTRAACLEFISQHWTDMRPKSLIEAMKQSSGSGHVEENPSPAAANEPNGNAANWDNKTRH
jgi:MbtH protein